MTRRAFFAALCAPYLVRIARYFPQRAPQTTLRLSLEEFQRRYIEPASIALANQIDTLAVGDVFTIAGVYSLNPVNHGASRDTQRFTVTDTEDWEEDIWEDELAA